MTILFSLVQHTAIKKSSKAYHLACQLENEGDNRKEEAAKDAPNSLNTYIPCIVLLPL